MALLLAGISFNAHEFVLRDKPQERLKVSQKEPNLCWCLNAKSFAAARRPCMFEKAR